MEGGLGGGAWAMARSVYVMENRTMGFWVGEIDGGFGSLKE